jgi:hypothetical protein
MKKSKRQNTTKKIAMFAGAAALMAFTPKTQAQSSDALIDKLVDKGILTVKEAQDLRDEADKDFTQAFQTKMGTPDWVTGYRFSGDFRGRLEDFTGENSSFADRIRWRYRIRFGVAALLTDNLEAGLRLGSGDTVGGFATQTGSPLSNNSSFQDDASKKFLYVDTAYGKWTPLNGGGWSLSTTFGKMDNPFALTPMVFDPDLTPEGLALQGGYTFNDQHSILFNSALFILDEEKTSTHDPMLYGAQVTWNANWTPKLLTSLGLAAFDLVNPEMLTTANVPYVNQGNSRTPGGVLINNYNPVIVDASVTYKLDTFPFYSGAFPIKLAGEFMNNPGTSHGNNSCVWAGITFGKSGTKHTWDISYRYEYLEANAWFDQLVDDDNGAFYQSALPVAGSAAGYFGGTNVKGHLIKANYSFTDGLTFTFTCFINDLISPNLNASPGGEPKNSALHMTADLMWKF